MSFVLSLGPLNHHLLLCHVELNQQVRFYGVFMERNSSGLGDFRHF